MREAEVETPQTKEVKIKTPDGFVLDGVFNKVSPKGIIFCHGTTMNKDRESIFTRVEPLLNERGFSTLRFDFRGHGKSSGDPTGDFTISGEITDLTSRGPISRRPRCRA
ncbi:MAG: alpha/beta fold hydrolase [Candidatus Curtissbacteria bacterium]